MISGRASVPVAGVDSQLYADDTYPVVGNGVSKGGFALEASVDVADSAPVFIVSNEGMTLPSSKKG